MTLTQPENATAASAVDNEKLTTLGAALRKRLDGPYVQQRENARATFPAANMLRDPSLDMDAARQWTLQRLFDLNNEGFGGAGIPDGPNAVSDPLTAVLAFETLSYGDLSVTIKSGVQFGLFGGAVMNLGTAWHHQEFLPKITNMSLLGGFAMTELGHGSDVASLETTITYVPETDEYEVHSSTPGATKAYIGNAGVDGTMMAVFGQLVVDGIGHGVHTILVPVRDDKGNDLPGVTTGDHGHKGGLNGVDNGTLRFDKVRVPRRMLLDRYGGVDDSGVYQSPIDNPNRRFFTMLGTLVRGRVCVGGGGAMAARRALSIATRHALARRQFPAPGRPDGVLLMDYLVHQKRLLPRIARSYALGFAQNTLIADLVLAQGPHESTEEHQRWLETHAAGLKSVSTWFANDAVQEAREACGGSGYMSENQLTLLRSDVDIFATFEGDNTVLMQLVTKALLTDYRKEWAELDRSGVVQATARVAGEQVLEATSANLVIQRLADAVRRKPEETTLVDRRWHALMFDERTSHALESLALRMRAAGKSKGDQFESFNALGDHVQFVARAYMEEWILTAFVDAIDALEDAEDKEILQQVCDLFALQSIYDDRAWFLEHNRISSGRSKAIGAQINDLCRSLRPHALPLVEGLGVPKDWLGAAILES